MISLRLRLFAFELFKAAKLSSSSGTPDFQQWNSGIPPVELASSTLGISWNSNTLLPLRHYKIVIKSIKIRVYKQINLLQKASISKNLLQYNNHKYNRLPPFAVDSADFFKPLSRARVCFKNTTHYTKVTKRRHLTMVLMYYVATRGRAFEVSRECVPLGFDSFRFFWVKYLYRYLPKMKKKEGKGDKMRSF